MMYLVRIIIFFLMPAFIQSTEDIFKRGCHEYQSGAFKKAYNYFNSIEPKNATVWYNLGNSAYQDGNVLEALLCWERAKKQAMGALYYACAFNSNKAKNKLDCDVDEPLPSILHVWRTKLPTGLRQLIFLVLWNVCILVIVLLRSWYARMMSITMSAILAILLVFCASSRNPSALIMYDDTKLYIGPNKDFHSMATIPSASFVSIVDTQASWYKVHYHDKVGWISMESLELI